MSRKKRIERQLTIELAPLFLSVEDESHNHHVPQGAQTHFKVIVVSHKFTELNRINRHRLVNRLLGEEFTLGLHALSLHFFSSHDLTAISPSSTVVTWALSLSKESNSILLTGLSSAINTSGYKARNCSRKVFNSFDVIFSM